MNGHLTARVVVIIPEDISPSTDSGRISKSVRFGAIDDSGECCVAVIQVSRNAAMGRLERRDLRCRLGVVGINDLAFTSGCSCALGSHLWGQHN